MKTFQEFMAEGADPMETKLSGGRGDDPDMAGVKPADDKKQITDHLKPQDTHLANYFKNIKPHDQMTYRQNSSNIPVHNEPKK